jgi:hypothetical protein
MMTYSALVIPIKYIIQATTKNFDLIIETPLNQQIVSHIFRSRHNYLIKRGAARQSLKHMRNHGLPSQRHQDFTG